MQADASSPLSSLRGKFAVLTILLAGLCGGGCKSLSSEAIWTRSYENHTLNGTRQENWYGFSTQEGSSTERKKMVCVVYIDDANPKNFKIEWGQNNGITWLQLDGARLRLEKGKCLLITNGKHGEALQESVPWMAPEEIEKRSSSDDTQEWNRVRKLFELLTSKP